MLKKKYYYNKKIYLENQNNWNKDLALQFAKEENIKITTNHWEVIKLIRQFYINFGISPKMRILVELMKKKFGKNKGNSCYLFYLFPHGPIKQAYKIAGLPQPKNCL